MQNPITEEKLSRRRKRLTFRASHRGMREMDILLGEYAKHHVDRMDETELDRFEALLDEPDQQLLAIFTAQAAAPEHLDRRLLAAIRRDAERAKSK
jgi:antitoxin CptB